MYSGDIAARLQLIDSGVLPVAAASAIAGDPVSTPAQRFAAVVEQKLADDNFSVLVGGRTLTLALPPQTEVGQQLLLRQAPGGRWVVAEPAPPAAAQVVEKLGGGQFKVLLDGQTLQLALPPETETGQIVQLRQSADGAWTAAATTGAGASMTQTVMSQAGRLVDLLLQATPEQSKPLVDPVPLLAAAPAAEPGPVATRLATALASALGESGVFYESHLSQWIAGNRSLAAIAREPQARLDSGGMSPTVPPASGTATPDAATMTLAAVTPDAGAMSASARQAGAHPEAVPMIARQLATLETGVVTWRGELWPGQHLSWNVARDDAGDESAGGGRGGYADREPPTWRTRLAVSFPHLGAVTATLALQGNTVRVTLGAIEPSTQEKLGAAGAALGSALAQVGMNMQKLEFERERAR